MASSRAKPISIEIVEADALSFSADVLAIKYVREHYGVDRDVAEELGGCYPNLSEFLPKVSGFRLLKSRGLIDASAVLFVGVSLYANSGIQIFANLDGRSLNR